MANPLAVELGRRGGLARAKRAAEKRDQRIQSPILNKSPDHRRRRFPHNGTVEQQRDWFRREFLYLASQESDPKERASLLKCAYATVGKPNSYSLFDEDTPTEALPDLSTLNDSAIEQLIGKSLSPPHAQGKVKSQSPRTRNSSLEKTA